MGSSCQVDHQKSCCPNLCHFSYLSAAMEAPNSPCTNVPIICPLCPSSAGTIWKYNAYIHFSKHHLSAVLTEHLSNITTSTSECAALQMKWEKCYSTCRQKPKGPGHASLVIAEQHSSWLAPSYVFSLCPFSN